MKSIKNYILVCCLALIASCNTAEEKRESAGNENEAATATASATDEALKAGLKQVAEHYIHLKNALVKTDSKEAKAGADGILKAISAIDTAKISDEQKADYNSAAMKIQAGARAISESGDIEKQREFFNGVTEGMYTLAKSFSVGKPLFYQYCPMANNSEGGYWLSENEEVNNPYFGDDMLHCGEVKETIQ
jgi:Cu(I)/Ag(I) efflux system membrane fusion protein